MCNQEQLALLFLSLITFNLFYYLIMMNGFFSLDPEGFTNPKKNLTFIFKNASDNSKVKQLKRFEANPTILVWTSSAFIERKGIDFTASKEYGSCHITMDRTLLNKSIAVVIFNNNLKLTDLPNPKTRKRDQVYVFWTTETPAKTVNFKKKIENPSFNPIFNLSMSLMKTADVQSSFGSYKVSLERAKRRKLTTEKSSELWKKTKLVVWTVSNCFGIPGANERMLYAKSLVKAGLKLDKYGKCFQGKRNDTAIKTIVENYKFYLAFENSLHCPDYITEKFWRNSIDSGLVPIVWGPTKQDVIKVAPPNSFIHVEDFKTPKDLVKMLNYLDKNYTAYMEYHKWRDTPLNQVKPVPVSLTHTELLSNLCKRLVVEKHRPKTIGSISKLIYETGYTDDKCLRLRTRLTVEQQQDLVDF